MNFLAYLRSGTALPFLTFVLFVILCSFEKNYSSQSLIDQDSDQDTDQVVPKMILEFCTEPRNKREICEHLGFNNLTYFTRTYLNPLLEANKLLTCLD